MPSSSFRWLVSRLLSMCVLSLTGFFSAYAQQPNQVFVNDTNQGPRHKLTQTLGNSGLVEPVILADTGETRVFYLPVPRNIGLFDQQVLFHARYLAGDDTGGRLQLMVNGEPVFTRVYASHSGEIDLKLPIISRESHRGFVELQVNWLSNRTLRACEIEPASKTSLIIKPTTGIAYSVKSSSVFDLASAWQLLPADGVLTVSEMTLNQAAFDAAWRVGAALELAGKRLLIKSLAREDAKIDVAPIQIPNALRGHAFTEEFNRESSSVILSDEVFGALLLLEPKRVLGDVVIADDALYARLERSLAAFKATLDTAEQVAWFVQAATKVHLDGVRMDKHNVMVLGTGEGRVIAIKTGAAGKVTALISQQWRNVLTTSALDVGAAQAIPLSPSGNLRLTSLGANTRSIDVVNHAIWQTDFAFRSVDFSGRVPNELVLDVAASPDTSGVRPVLSVSWNDILLTATQLQADGEAERISTRIPSYAIGQSNRLKVFLQRLPSANGCTEPQAGFPFAVLPTSYVGTEQASPEPTFVGVMPMLAHEASLVVPADWLADAPEHLPSVIRLAIASGLSPHGAKLVLQAPSEVFEPSSSFVAMDVRVLSVSPGVSVQDDGRLVIGKHASDLLNIGGLRNVSSVEVVRSGEYYGLLWNKLPTSAKHGSEVKLVTPYELDRGDIAVVTSTGLISWIDSTDPAKATLTERVQSAFYEWRRFFSWGVPTIVGSLLLVLLLLALAYRAGRRNGTK
jgi:hypothetical protein